MIIESKEKEAGIEPPRNQTIYIRDLIKELVARDMKLRYKRSILGMVWSLVNPLAQLLVLYFVFFYVIQVGIQNFTLFLFSGLLTWNWFQSSLIGATGSIVQNGMMIRRPGFPIALLPVVTVITNFIHFLIALPILFVFVWFSGINVGWSIVAFPLIIIVQFTLTLALAYFLAAIHVTFRDTEYLLGIALLLGFYLSPVFYDAVLVPEQFRFIYNLNPMVHIISAYREILIFGRFPFNNNLAILFIGSLIGLAIGYFFFTRSSYRFAEEI
ncbi:MAG: ABC transporter permease [Anaerolineae bacterium]